MISRNAQGKDDSTILAMEHNMREKLRYVASRIGSMEAMLLNGIPIVNSKHPSATFNTAFGGKIDIECASAVYEYYGVRKLPMAWWMGPTSSTQASIKSLLQAGFHREELDIGMTGKLNKMPVECDATSGLCLKECETPQDFADFGSVLASVFVPPDTCVVPFFQAMAMIPPNERREMLLFVGYEQGVPVATACLFLTDVAGIYDISTRPDRRKRGYGSAMFQKAVSEANRRGFQRGVLQASPDGLNIYQRFGFVGVCEFTVWSNSGQRHTEH